MCAATVIAIDYLQDIGMENVFNHEKSLVSYALEKFSSLENIDILGSQNPSLKGGVISFNHKFIHPHDLGTLLDNEGIAVRTGHHCTMPLMKSLGVPATLRASFYIYNTEEEITKFFECYSKSLRFFDNVR